MKFEDHFSLASSEYRTFRPQYPPALFTALRDLCVRHDLAWDCATGSGQAAVSLADYFSQVCATDASASQIANATPRDGVRYAVSAADCCPLADNAADLVTVAQALHWFDIEAFSREVRRVLRPGGILAVWTYNLFEVTTKIDRPIRTLYHDLLGSFWPTQRRHVENGYGDLVLPFQEQDAPSFSMHADWSLADVRGYLATWSAVARYRKANGSNPLDIVHDDLLRAWGDPSRRRRVSWPITVRIWRHAQ